MTSIQKKLKTIKQIIEQTALKFYLNDQKIAFEKKYHDIMEPLNAKTIDNLPEINF